MSARTPEPGYVLLLSCPTAAVAVLACVAGKQEVDVSSNMEQLCEILQEGLSPAWGSMPTAWRALAQKNSSTQPMYDNSQAAATRNAVPDGAQAQPQLGSHSRRRSSQLASLQQQDQGQLGQQEVVFSGHGLQMSSRTRSLAGMQVGISFNNTYRLGVVVLQVKTVSLNSKFALTQSPL